MSVYDYDPEKNSCNGPILECPRCEHSDIITAGMCRPAQDGPMIDPDRVLVEMWCGKCGKTWKEFYVFEGMLI